MKHTSLLVPVLVAAALAAVAASPPPQAPIGPAEPASSAAAVDPHAGLYAMTDPHAASFASDAALHGADDPHAALPHAAHADPHAVANPHGPRAREPLPSAVAVPRSRAENGRTVAEVFEQRAALAGQRVSLRATVVRATDGVLGKTYLHLQDGSGSPELGTHDLTATTTEAFEMGETVEVEGVLAIDQDVGLDYRYPALLGDLKRTR